MPKLSSNTKVMGFDFGTKYIGVATGQTVTYSATALCTLSAKEGIPDWSEIEKLIDQWQPHYLLVGVPLNMDGTEQPMTHRAKKFMHRLKTKFSIETFEVDERLTSWEIQNQQGKRDKKSKHSHAKAAALIIEQWFSEQRNEPQGE